MKKDSIQIQSERLILSSLTKDDLDFTLDLRNIPSIRKWFTNSDEIQRKNHYAWFESYVKKQDDYIFVVRLKDNNMPIGQVAIYNIEHGLQAEVGRFMCDPLWQGKGYIKEAITGLLSWSRINFRPKFIYLYVVKANANAITLYEKLGFENVEQDDRKSFNTPNTDEVIMKLIYEN